MKIIEIGIVTYELVEVSGDEDTDHYYRYDHDSWYSEGYYGEDELCSPEKSKELEDLYQEYRSKK